MKNSFENNLYGERLKHFRKINKLTQENVSNLTGLEVKYISQIECGRAKGTIDTMLKFCIAYNVTPNDILCDFIGKNNTAIELEKFNNNLSKLSKRDKIVVFSLIESLLNN